MSGGIKRKNSSVTEGVNEATDVAANNNNIQEKSAEKQSSPNKRIKVCKTNFYVAKWTLYYSYHCNSLICYFACNF